MNKEMINYILNNSKNESFLIEWFFFTVLSGCRYSNFEKAPR